MLKTKLGLFVFLFQLSTLAFSDDGSSCVDSYLDFEEQTFDNNSENRVKLYQAFYPPNDHLPYSVVVSYQAVLPNGTRVNISTDPAARQTSVAVGVFPFSPQYGSYRVESLISVYSQSLH